MKFGVVVSKNNKKAKELFEEVENYLKKRKQEVVLNQLKGVDVVLTLGGDGTLLHAAGRYAELEVPFVGINVGTLGFLTAEEADNWKKALDKVVEGRYFTSERMVIEAQVADRTLMAVNEVVIKGLYRVVDFEVSVCGKKLLEVAGDGVIVATQTGSTAYSLSSGGPIVDPDLDSILVTPVNPIGLPIPSIVLSPSDVVEVAVKKGDDVTLTADGQEHTRLEIGDVVKVARALMHVRFVYFDKHQFIKSLNAKFALSVRRFGRG